MKPNTRDNTKVEEVYELNKITTINKDMNKPKPSKQLSSYKPATQECDFCGRRILETAKKCPNCEQINPISNNYKEKFLRR